MLGSYLEMIGAPHRSFGAGHRNTMRAAPLDSTQRPQPESYSGTDNDTSEDTPHA